MEASTIIKPTTVRYWSISDNFTIYRVKPDELTLPNGKTHVRNTRQVADGTITFQNNQHVTSVGAKLLPTGPPDDDGEPTLEDEVTFLERQPSFGQYFHRVDAEVPDTAPVLQQITELAVAQDLEGLVGLAETEQANWARAEVGHGIVTALAALHRAAEEDEKRQAEITAAFERVLACGVQPPPEE